MIDHKVVSGWQRCPPLVAPFKQRRVNSNLQGNSPESKSFRGGAGLEGKKETARAIKDYSKICEAAASLLNKRKLPRPFRSETRAIYSDYNGKTPSRQAREISAPSSKCESERRRYRRGFWRRDELEEEEATRALSMPVVATIKVAILV
ncbi:hypothetical protein TNCV_3114841 [Trichonephila clavipes]|nr:hypothetical protein TNCV_3114841 [Trichonephila clavipes]